VGDISSWLEQSAVQVRTAPADIYMVATGHAPPWRPKPVAVLDPVTLNQAAGSEQLVLASESESDGITRGVLVRATSDNGKTVNLRAAPGTDTDIVKRLKNRTLLVVLEGPKRAGDSTWWKVSDTESEGWCAAESLELVSR
jgi:hypothetical protein